MRFKFGQSENDAARQKARVSLSRFGPHLKVNGIRRLVWARRPCFDFPDSVKDCDSHDRSYYSVRYPIELFNHRSRSRLFCQSCLNDHFELLPALQARTKSGEELRNL